MNESYFIVDHGLPMCHVTFKFVQSLRREEVSQKRTHIRIYNKDIEQKLRSVFSFDDMTLISAH